MMPPYKRTIWLDTHTTGIKRHYLVLAVWPCLSGQLEHQDLSSQGALGEMTGDIY